MLIYKNFIPYIPESGEKKELADMGYEFLQDNEGNDWYEVQDNFSEGTLKIAYFPDGKIDSVSFDVSALVRVACLSQKSSRMIFRLNSQIQGSGYSMVIR